MECWENEDYVRAANSKGEYFSAESLFIVLILQQQIEFSGHSKMQDLGRSWQGGFIEQDIEGNCTQSFGMFSLRLSLLSATIIGEQ